MAEEHGDAAGFLLVYIREAHASDEWETKDNLACGLQVAQPTTDEERRAAAAEFARAVDWSLPIVVDGVDDAVGIPWGAWPERLYVLDAEGRVLYRGGMGPFEFKPEEVEAILRDLPR